MVFSPSKQPQSLPVVSSLPLPQTTWVHGLNNGRRIRRLRALPKSSLNLQEWLGGKKTPEGMEGLCPTKNEFQVSLEGELGIPDISKPDAAFAEDGIEFVKGYKDINIEDLNDLFVKVGFCHRNEEKLALALQNTHSVYWVKCTKKTRWARYGQLLGFARAMSDGVLSATIWDLAVLPAWQRGGLGRGLVERLVKQLREEGIFNISLYAEPHVVRLYEHLGFVKEPEGIKGMAFQRRSALGRKVAMKQND